MGTPKSPSIEHKVDQVLCLGNKVALYRLFQNDSTSRGLGFQAMVMADHYRSPHEAQAVLQEWQSSAGDPYALFASTYARLALGEAQAVPIGIQELQKISQRPLYLGQWLLIEHAGRARQFAQQAELVSLALKQETRAKDWIFHAVLRSIDQDNPDLMPLRKLLTKVKDDSPLLHLLRWRVAEDMPIVERITKLENLARHNPQIAPIRVQLAALYFNVGQGRNALATLDHVAELDALDAGMIGRRLALAMMLPDTIGTTEQKLMQIMQQVPQTVRQCGIVASYLLVLYWLTGRLVEAYETVKEHYPFTQLEDCDNDRPARVFFNYVVSLCVHWQENQRLYQGSGLPLTVIGESHSLSPHLTKYPLQGTNYRTQAAFVMGCKMFHLGSKFRTVYQEAVEAHLADIEPASAIMFAIGEIDCRPEEGIWPAAQKSNKRVLEIANKTVDGYLTFVAAKIAKYRFSKVIIQGVAAPGYELTGKRDPGDKPKFLGMIKAVNERLKAGSLAFGWQFLDIYSATADENGLGNRRWHLDGWHLKPSFYQQADRWLVKPPTHRG